MKILIIIPYFGNCPKWIDYFLQSCSYNTSISWLLYSDIEKPYHCPLNVGFEKKTLSDFNKLASKKLNLDIQIFNPYKICDLRPAFGEIFKEYLIAYDFWGYSDIDLIYGDIKSFITNDILENYEIISCRQDYLAGHFTFYKNSEKTNQLFRKCKNYRDVFENNYLYFAFDERSNLTGRRLYKTGKVGFTKYFFSTGENIIGKIRIRLNKKKYINCQDITQITDMLVNNGIINLYKKDMVFSDLRFEEKGIKNWQIIWDSGKLMVANNNEEILHFHLYKLKSIKNLSIDKWQQNNKFIINNNGIHIV